MRRLKVVRQAEREAIPLSRPSTLPHRHVISLHDLTPAEVEFLLKLGQRVKAEPSRYRSALDGKTLAMLFEKPSLRTRVTFELGMTQLGGEALYLGPQEVGLGKRESVKDVARNLSRWVNAVTVRAFAHQTVMELAENASVPVINALSNFEHPCQALGDSDPARAQGPPRGEDTRLGWRRQQRCPFPDLWRRKAGSAYAHRHPGRLRAGPLRCG